MRRLLFASTLLLAACATAPQQQQQPVAQIPVVAQPQPAEAGALVGLSVSALVGYLGNPQFQVREGSSMKLQFRSDRCVLDAYLYPDGGSGPLRVTHIDTRTPAGVDTSQAACIFALKHPS